MSEQEQKKKGIQLHVDLQKYSGWTDARIVRGIESISGGFELTVTSHAEPGRKPWAVRHGDICQLSINEELILSGSVDKRSTAYDANSHSISVSGRDRAGFLVDCSAVLSKWEYVGVPVLDLAKKVAEPFDIEVSLGPGVKSPAPARKLSVDPGDSAFDVIERLCRAAGLLPVSDGVGGIQLMRPGSSRATDALIEGENIKSLSVDFDATGRFHRYLVLGQHAGTDQWSGMAASAIKAESFDRGVRSRSRVLVVRPEGNLSGEQAKVRAQWEATVRAARATTVNVQVQGWTQSNGKVWPVNALVPVRSLRAGLNGDMLITQATYSVGANGTVTDLVLRPPKAFLPEPTLQSGGTWDEIKTGA